MDQVGKLDGVPNKEHRNVIPDNVPIVFLRVKLHCEAANISRQVCRAFTAGYSREAHEGGVSSSARWKMSALVMSTPAALALMRDSANGAP
jgi:hypothetical protein